MTHFNFEKVKSHLVTGSSEDQSRILLSGGDGGNPVAVATEHSSKLKLFSHCFKICRCVGNMRDHLKKASISGHDFVSTEPHV